MPLHEAFIIAGMILLYTTIVQKEFKKQLLFAGLFVFTCIAASIAYMLLQ